MQELRSALGLPLPLPWHQRAFLPMLLPSEEVDAVRGKNLPQDLDRRKTGRMRGVLEDHRRFLPSDLHWRPVSLRAEHTTDGAAWLFWQH